MYDIGPLGIKWWGGGSVGVVANGRSDTVKQVPEEGFGKSDRTFANVSSATCRGKGQLTTSKGRIHRGHPMNRGGSTHIISYGKV